MTDSVALPPRPPARVIAGVVLDPLAARQLVRDALGLAAQALLFATPESMMGRPDWADPDGLWLLEVQGAGSARALGWGDRLAALHRPTAPEQGEIQAARTWRTLRALLGRLDREFPLPAPKPEPKPEANKGQAQAKPS